MQELGHGCIYLVQKAGALQLSPTDSFSKRELIECARAVTEKVSYVDRELKLLRKKALNAYVPAKVMAGGIVFSGCPPCSREHGISWTASREFFKFGTNVQSRIHELNLTTFHTNAK